MSKIKDYMESINICGDYPWFDKETIYYNLTEDQLVKFAEYYKKETVIKAKTSKHPALSIGSVVGCCPDCGTELTYGLPEGLQKKIKDSKLFK